MIRGELDRRFKTIKKFALSDVPDDAILTFNNPFYFIKKSEAILMQKVNQKLKDMEYKFLFGKKPPINKIQNKKITSKARAKGITGLPKYSEEQLNDDE